MMNSHRKKGWRNCHNSDHNNLQKTRLTSHADPTPTRSRCHIYDYYMLLRSRKLYHSTNNVRDRTEL